MSSLTDNYPLACLPIANKPILSHQIKYLEANGLYDIYVVVNKENKGKIEKFLNQHSDTDPRTSLYLVVIREETESANALKLIGQLQIKQEQMGSKPSYEMELYHQKGKKRQMDLLNFDKENVVVLEGNSIPDTPLSQPLVDH